MEQFGVRDVDEPDQAGNDGAEKFLVFVIFFLYDIPIKKGKEILNGDRRVSFAGRLVLP